MIYLGEKSVGLSDYSSIVLCWLKIKLRGKCSNSNPNGHNCGNSSCLICTANYKRKTNLNPDFVQLLNDSILQFLITHPPGRLPHLCQVLQQMYMNKGYTVQEFNREAKSLFVKSGYEGFFYKNLNYKLANWLDIHTCTYCNRQYIFVFRRQDGSKGMVPQFDHWFPKNTYPILALSFYNLIPSCSTCNSAIKSTSVLNLADHLHPYIDKKISSSFRFSYLAKSPSQYEIICQNLDYIGNKGKNTTDALDTKLLYRGHSNKELKDLINLRYKYSDNYLKILLESTFNNLNISNQEKFRLIFGVEIDEDKYHKRPLSKFKKDIISELISIKQLP